MKNILITGGGGYIGTNLTNELLSCNYKVTVIDTFWFGNYLKKEKNLKVIKKDIRKLSDKDLSNVDCIIHLASIANDPAAELDPKLTWDVNVLATYKLIDIAIKKKVKKFIFASSGSVYGIKKEKKVTEELSLEPLSEYNKSKMIGERILLSFNNYIDLTILRPATVCGYSSSMRLDVAVNALSFSALNEKKIKVFGGRQIRPNLTMKDMINAYKFFLKKKFLKGKKLEEVIFNIGFENLSIIEIAKKVKNTLNSDADIIVKSSNDPRSYKQHSSRILKAGFSPRYKIEDSIIELKKQFSKNKLKKKKSCFRINTLKIIKAK